MEQERATRDHRAGNLRFTLPEKFRHDESPHTVTDDGDSVAISWSLRACPYVFLEFLKENDKRPGWLLIEVLP